MGLKSMKCIFLVHVEFLVANIAAKTVKSRALVQFRAMGNIHISQHAFRKLLDEGLGTRKLEIIKIFPKAGRSLTPRLGTTKLNIVRSLLRAPTQPELRG